MSRVLSNAAVTEAVEATLQAWMPYALYVLAQSESIDTPPDINSYARPSDPTLTAEDQFPILAVTSPGLAASPISDGYGIYRAPWSVQITVYVRGTSVDEVSDLVKRYCAAVRAVGTHKGDWGGVASSSYWTAETFNLIDANDTRTLGGGRVGFTVEVDNTTGSAEWPPTPPTIPPAPPHTAHTIVLNEQLLPR